MFNSDKGLNVAVLGGGIVGLSSAFRLIEVFEEKNLIKNLHISIISESYSINTTSDGAGGLFRTDDRFMKGVPKDVANKWCKSSFDYYDKLLFSKEGGKAGIFQASGYQLFDDERVDPSYKNFVYDFRLLTEKELENFNKFYRKFKYGYFSTTICIDARTYMKYLKDILVSKGVKFIQRKLENKLHDFLSENSYDVVFNCLGLGAINFCDDKKLVPIRGQMIRVNAPWIKHYYYTGDDCYIIPNINTICLGGTRQVGNFSLELDDVDSNGIMQRCKQLCPSLENAKVEWEWVGLRPHREPTRVEKEIYERGNSLKKRVIVIHNYGHGGNGVSLSWGTSVNAVELLLDELNSSKSNIFHSKL